MNQQINEIQDTDDDQPLLVTELAEFIPLIEAWHQRQVLTVEHLQKVPSGQEVEIEDEPVLVLEGDSLRAFQLGISMALHYLGSLPFSADRDAIPPVMH